MNQSSKLLKYLEGMRVVEFLHADERAIYSLFGLSFDLTAETILEQQEEFKKSILKGIILELLDYNVDEVSDPHNYTGTGKLQYELYKYGDQKIIDVLYAIFGRCAEDHGVGSTDHFQEPAVMTLIHYCFHSHFIYLDK